MLSNDYKCIVSIKAKECLVNMASSYVDSADLGRDDGIDDLKKRIEMVKFILRTIGSYENKPILDKSKMKYSDSGYGRFFSKNVSDSVSLLYLNPDDVNCLTEQEMCDLLNQLFTICPNC